VSSFLTAHQRHITSHCDCWVVRERGS